jgi:glycosyltransferase involved in cell wall biosynthesis
MDESPTLSFVIPTLNSAATLGECLAAIRGQDLPRDAYEIIIADAGSTDATRDIAREHGVDRVVDNPLKTGEAGKTAGIRAACGALIALVDSDNILPGPGWLRAMLAPFDDPAIAAAEPLHYTRRGKDPSLTRYFALLGMNDPLCLFLGNYDRLCGVTGKWTGLDVPAEDRGPWLALDCDPASMPTIGANGFVFRRSALAHMNWEPYFFDMDVARQIAAARAGKIAKVKCGIVHLYCACFGDFLRKQDRRVRDFLFYSQNVARARSWQGPSLCHGVIRFTLATVFVLPLLVQQLRGMARQPDRAWWWHLPVCVATLWIYGRAVILKKLGLLKGPAERANWQRHTAL